MVITRFAPSPTGYLHVGGARTALFNWLYARRMGGRFILRIEDTDLKRNTPTAMQQVIDDMKWLGIEWDEGPGVGGPNGPYLQSQRIDIYTKYCDRLIDEGKAYYCFDTIEELQAGREDAAEEKQGFKYPRPAVFPDRKDAARARAEGRPVAVRLAVPQDKPFIVNDLLRGPVTFGPGEIGDFVILKSDGFPTYHFAVVVDDELMGVTHVIRGQEHLMNTPAHLALQQALGFRTPAYVHMSVTVSPSGGKLSKRERPKALREAIARVPDPDLAELASAGGITVEQLQDFLDGKSTPDMPAVDAIARHIHFALPEINIVDFFRSGYLPETMVNFLALLGWNPGDGREVMSRRELIDSFSLERCTKSNSLFDRKKLLAFNTEHIRTVGSDKLLAYYRDFLRTMNSPAARADDALLQQILACCHGARTLAEIEQKTRFLFVDNDRVEYDAEAVKKVLIEQDGMAVLGALAQRFSDMEPMTPQSIEQALRQLADDQKTGLGKVAQPLRVALCGNTISPPIFDAVAMLGKANTLERIGVARQRFGTETK